MSTKAEQFIKSCKAGLIQENNSGVELNWWVWEGGGCSEPSGFLQNFYKIFFGIQRPLE